MGATKPTQPSRQKPALRGCPRVGDHFHARGEIAALFTRSPGWISALIKQGAPVAKCGLIHCQSFHEWLKTKDVPDTDRKPHTHKSKEIESI